MTVLLIDANNVAMRSLHAMAKSGLSSDDGVPTGPLLAFINALSKHIREEQPRSVGVCWDGGRSARRVAASPEYKAHRLAGPDEVEDNKHSVFSMAKEFCTLAGLYHVERPGMEADDLIAHYWRWRNPGEKTVLVSNDKDFLQLLEPRVEQVRLSSNNTPTDRWTRERVIEEMGCLPDHLPYAMALAGDASDNVFGIRGFGMKTAIKAVIKGTQEQLERVASGDLTVDEAGHWFSRVLEQPKIAPHVDQVRLNYDLVDLRETHDPGLHLPALPLFTPTAPGSALYEPLLSFLTKYQMKSVTSRLVDGSLWK